MPRKNILPLLGKPLIAWTIEQALSSKYLDRIIVSTDDKKISEISEKYGADVPFLRPSKLAQDDTPGIAPVLHAIKAIPDKYDYIVLLQPTSPLRKTENIDGCIELCIQKNAPACVSVTKPDKNPYWMYKLHNNGCLVSLIESAGITFRRQDIPKVFVLNGAVYIAETQWIKMSRTFLTSKTIGYVMPKISSFDIDDDLDFKICEFLLSKE